MESYKVKALIWSTPWEGHEIRFEFITKYVYGAGRTLLFFDDKCVAKSDRYLSNDCDVSAQIQTDNGNSYLIECGIGNIGGSKYQWPLPKFFLLRFLERMYRFLTSNKCFAWFTVNEKLIYLSHIGGTDAIEWVKIQQDLELLTKQEKALTKGKIMILSSSGWRKRNASMEEVKQTKTRLVNERKALETKLSLLETKNKGN